LYSAHDTNVALILKQIAPKFNFDYIKFASNIYIELHKIEGEFFIRFNHNGKGIELDMCDGKVMCPISDFFVHMSEHLYTEDLKDACFTPAP